MIRKFGLAALACALLAIPAASQVQPPAAPAAATPATPAPGTEAPVSGSTTPALTAADLGAWLDGYFPGALKAGKIAGAQIVVVKDGQILVKKGYGYADVAKKAAMDPDRNLMRIGSTSKLLTWTAVMQQVEAGKIDLNADINRYLDFKITPKSGRAITMNDLMMHRGGFEEGIKDLLDTDPKRFKTTERYLKENPRPMLFPAGTVPAYSNYGVSVAGYIVQRVSGEPFADYVARHILAPLKMNRTTFVQPLPPALAGSQSQGYRQSDEPPAKFELVTTAPAGSVSTTAADMANFMIAQLQDGRLGDAQILQPQTVQLMHRPETQPRAGFDTLAHGFFYGDRNGRLVLGHGGDTIVFHTDLNILPAEKVGIYVSFNSRGTNDAVYGVRSRLFDLFMDRYFPATPRADQPAIAGAAQHAAALAGNYESSRRVESGFISLFYLLQQDKVVADDDGTISVSSIEDKRFRETAPNLWHEVGGTQQLQVADVAGRRTIIDSANPVSFLQAVPAARNAGLNLWIAGLSVLVLLATTLLWPIAASFRRIYALPITVTGRAALARRLTRIAAIGDLLYLAGWYTILSPILESKVDVYNSGLDGWVRTMQVAAIIPIVGAAIGLWNAYLHFQPGRGWASKVRSIGVALALLGIAWIAWMGGLMSFNLNY
ncbi:serine hydrolase domain-containing protein [Sphingomonas endolithica]|uniref:serine hydrolase domain-containing protein n=1 Tax=Sphingomonas endolithica TaxID=2972485 RepID=UPI0021B00DD9|nr:serine hydrolase domain-containing protein [Sphingomonas sp. ZFBP2030]